MTQEPSLSFRAGAIRLDLRRRLLVVEGRPAKTSSRAFDLLHALVERSDRVVGKQELLDLVWPGLVVEENNLHVHVMKLRRLLGDDVIATVPGRGYRFTLEPDRGNAGRPEPVAGVAGRAALALPATQIFGRDDLIGSVVAALRSPAVRLVTLTGPGGSGKTRVGLRATADLAPGKSDGAAVVLLAPLDDPALVTSAIASALGVQEAGTVPVAQLLMSHLRDRTALVTLDNFEHVLAAAPLVATLLAACPGLQILVTSRVPLKLPGEHVVAVPPLPVPSRHASADEIAAAPSMQLLRERARAAGREVGGSAGDIAALAEIVRTLDGLPLAIELAATRLRTLSPQVLLRRLGSRLQLLENAGSDVPQRQRTLRATLNWSHELLDDGQRRVFRRLAVFAGGWSLDAAESVADQGDLHELVLDPLATLIDHGLVQRLDDIDGEPRFSMLQIVRDYARELLDAAGETAALRNAHAAFFTDLAERAEPALTSPQRGRVLARLVAEHDNLRAALHWLIREHGDGEAGLRLAAALPWFWYFSNHLNEGREGLRAALALAGNDAHDEAGVRARARALCGAARLDTYLAALPDALAHATRSIELWRTTTDRRGLAFGLFHLAVPALLLRGRADATAALDEALALFRDAADAWGTALAIVYKGVVLAFGPGAEAQAEPLLLQGRAQFLALGDIWGASTAPGYLAAIAMRAGDFERARAISDENLHELVELNDTYRLARWHHQRAVIAMLEGDNEGALDSLRASLTLNRQQNRWGDAALQLRMIARLEGTRGFADRAVRLFATGMRPDAPRAALEPDDPRANEQALAAARAKLGPFRSDAEWALGTAMSVDQAAAWVLSGYAALPAAAAPAAP